MLFFFNDTATAEIYTLSLHDALPIYGTSKTTTFTTLILRWAGPEAFAAGFAHAPERRGREPDGGPSHPGQTLGQLKRERHRSTSEATAVPRSGERRGGEEGRTPWSSD